MKHHSFLSWLIATRPWSFTASALTVLVVLSYSEWLIGSICWLNGLWAILSIILFHAAGNTWSDWHDFRSGIDAADTHGVDTLTSGRFSPAAIRNLSLALYAAASATGLGLMLHTGLPLLWIGLAGLLGALLYPFLKRCALGDVVILLNYCLLPAWGTSYIATGRILPEALWAALPVGLLVVAILHANNTRDRRTDRRAGALTLSHALGLRASVILYLLEELLPFAWVAVLSSLGLLPVWALLVFLSLPIALRNCRSMSAYRDETQSVSIAALDQCSAQLQLLFSLLLTTSFFIDKW